MKNKKADLSLSINAIVILILAITMLGLGLGFIRGMFGKVSTSFESMVSNEQDPTAASSQIPITASKETVIGKPGEQIPIKFSAYCFKGAGLSCDTLTIGGPTGTDCGIASISGISTKATSGGQPSTFAAVLTLGSTTGSSVCTFTTTKTANGGELDMTKDIVVQVRK
jgi:hypothetical protein